MKNRIVFLFHTEYHLLIISSIISDLFNSDDEIILIQHASSSKRFNLKIDTSLLRCKYITIKQNNVIDGHPGTLSDLSNWILGLHPHKFIGFLEQNAFFIFLSYHLKSIGCTIALAQDGGKAYAKITKLALPSRFRMTWSIYKFMFKHKLKFTPISLLNWKFASNRHIREIWVTFPDYFVNRTSKVVRKISILESAKSKLIANSIFGFNERQRLLNTENLIFYLNQPLTDAGILAFEDEMLNHFIKIESKKQLIVKLHPLTSEKQINAYKKYPEILIIHDNLPAELYIANLNNSLIISFWSSALFVNNSNCKFYWLNGILKKRNLMIGWLDIHNPTSHIQVVSDINEIRI